MANPQTKKRKSPKTFENKSLSGPEYEHGRSGKIQKIGLQDAHARQAIVPGKPRSYTVSVAVPSSCIDNAPTLELKTILAGQIARVLALYSVDEIVIYEDRAKSAQSKVDANLFLARVLQHMETPHYLRKALVPWNEDLKFAGLLPALDMPHHPSMHQSTRYREGVVLDKIQDGTTLVDVGMHRRARIDKPIKSNVRVTVELSEPTAAADTRKGQKPLQATVVSPKRPRETAGLYWGYTIRLASSFSRVVTESPFADGYDQTIGVSDLGAQDVYTAADAMPPSFSHLLIAFGGSGGGLQEAIEADEDLKVGKDDAADMFDLFVNPNASSGSASIKLEESMMIVLSVLKPKIIKNSG